MITAIVTVLGILLLATFGYATVVSFVDGEKRAGAISLLFALVLPMPFLATGLLVFPFQQLLTALLLGCTVVVATALLVPIRARKDLEANNPTGRIDERTIMFSRRLLEPGTDRFDDYYASYPTHKPLDDQFRCRPGLLGKGAAHYDPHAFEAAKASFFTIAQLRPYVDGEPANERIAADPVDFTRFVKAWVKKLGARDVGVTKLEDHHLYSVIGRGTDYGAPVEQNHEYGIALTVEMDRRMLTRGPKGPTVMESAQQYVDSGVIAVQVAAFIRGLGYSARAHIDGNYRVVCPLVARDAGLGEIGRMGLLMTPKLGPRVRIAVITTNLPLVPDRSVRDNAVIDFCTHCRKCANCCPPWAIPFEDRQEIDGVKRWQIKQELCYVYWSHVGTDCGRCVAVCPYSHPNRMLHNFVRWGVRRSALFRRVAIEMDKLFYGRKPRTASLQTWMNVRWKTEGENVSSAEPQAKHRT